MEMDNLKDFGKRFKELRIKDLDMGQVELAEFLEVSHAAVSAIETGKSKGLKLENLVRLSIVCKEQIDRILSFNWLIMNHGAKFILSEKEAEAEINKILQKEGYLKKK